jgi:hypothetical protein
MAIAGRHHQIDFIHLAGKCPLGALYIGHQYGDIDPFPALNAGHYISGITQVGDRFGGGERGCFDAAQAGGGERIDPADFLFGGHKARLNLQAVPGGDFIDFDLCRAGRWLAHRLMHSAVLKYSS